LAAALSIRQYENEAMLAGLDISIGPNGLAKNRADFDTYVQDYLMKSNSSQRGNSENMDWYSIAGLTIVFKITGARQKSCPAYKKHTKYKEYLLF
jgi:hypothetical protein